MSDLTTKQFLDADQQPVTFDGSPITWRVSAYVLVLQEKKILLCKNRLEELYDALGGGVDLGETIEESLHREAMEEAGAQIKLGSLVHAQVDWFYHRKGTFHQTLRLFYQAELVDTLQTPTDSNMEWAGFVELQELGDRYKIPTIVSEVIAMLRNK